MLAYVYYLCTGGSYLHRTDVPGADPVSPGGLLNLSLEEQRIKSLKTEDSSGDLAMIWRSDYSQTIHAMVKEPCQGPDGRISRDDHCKKNYNFSRKTTELG